VKRKEPGWLVQLRLFSGIMRRKGDRAGGNMEETIKGQLNIVKTSTDIRWAKEAAEHEYNKYFEKLHPYITQVHIQILRELYADRGQTGYLIRVYVEAPADVVAKFHAEAGVEVSFTK